MSAAFEYQGFDVSSQWSGALTSANYASALTSIAAVGSNSIGISTKLFVTSGTSSAFVTDAVQSTSDASLVAGIKAAEAKGLKVILEPHISGVDGTNANALAPADVDAFFSSYKAQIVHLATIAQATGVDTLSLGNEMATLTGSAYRAQWLDVISAVRAVYAGKLTYQAATNEASSVSFWDKVDTIGVNAYLSLSSTTNPTVADLEKAWTTPPADNYWNAVLNGESMVDFMHSLATTYGKQVLITEVGFRSIDGAATNPGQSNRVGTADTTDQTNAYKALFQVMQSQGGSWFAGLELFEYNLGLTDAATNYSPVGKPAMAIVQQYFSGTGTVVGSVITGSVVNDLIDVGAGDDTINAGLGNDIIMAGAGNDTINAGPDQITTLKNTTVTIMGFGANGRVALLVNGQQIGDAVTFTAAADTTGYQTYTFTFANPDAIKSLDLSLLNGSSGGNAMIRSITINGAALGVGDVTNVSAPGSFDLYAKSIHLDATSYQDWFYGAQTDDDLITVGTGNDTVNGGAGLDTVVFTGNAGDYTMSRSGGTLYVTDRVAGRNGTTTLSHVEYLQFADAAYAVASLLVPDQGTTTVSALMAPLVSSAILSAGNGGPAGAPQIKVSGASAAGATVSLLNGSTVLATTTADSATGAYAFALSGVAGGIYTLTTRAALGALGSSASDPVVMAVGTAATIVGLLQSATTVPQAVYVTDPSNAIVATVAQLRAVSAALSHSVTANTLTVSDTAANVAASIDLLGTQTSLSRIVLTDTHTFAVSSATMKLMIANNAAVLAKIQGSYFFAVTATTATGAATTTTYDATATVTQTQTVTALASGGTETYTATAAGAVSDVFTNAAGAKTSQSVTDSTGKHVTQYGITGKSYTTALYDYNAAGKLTALTESYANGVTYLKQITASDGSTQTDVYDASGTHVQEVVTTPSASNTITYTAAGAKSTETLVDGTGKHVTSYGITGKTYTTATYDYNAAGVLTGMSEYYANGALYLTQVIAANGITTTDQYDAVGHRVQEVVVTPAGAAAATARMLVAASTSASSPVATTRTINYAINGSKTDETLVDGTGKHVTTYGITGKSYTSATSDYSPSNVLVGMTEYYANGGVYLRQGIANGITTTDQYDTSGTRVQTVVATATTTDTITYGSSGAKSTETLVDAAGKHVTTYGITGKSYTTATFDYTTSGALAGQTDYYASGGVYLKQVVANGTTTTDQYDTAGNHAQKVVATAASTDTITYTAAGAKSAETLVDALGKHITTYGITGKTYTTSTIDYSTAGVLTGMTQYYANGSVYLKQLVANGITTTDQYDTGGAHVQEVVATAASTDTITYTAAGAKSTETLVDALGKHITTYGITGKTYTTSTADYSPAGKLTAVTQRYANGTTYISQTVAADGATTTNQYDPTGTRVQQVVATATTTDTISYTSAGAKSGETLVDALGKHITTYGITGKSYSTSTADYSTAGVLQDIVQGNTDESQSATFYAAGASLTFGNAKTAITSFGGDTMTFASTPFADTIKNFQGGGGSGHDTIVLAKSLVADFGHLAIATAGQTTTVAIDSQHTLALTGMTGALSASNFKFV